MGKVYHVDFKKRTLVSEEKSSTEPLPRSIEKFELFSTLIGREMTQVLVNSLHEGVSLPEHIIGNPAVPVNWSHKFGIADFVYDADGIQGTLSFNKKNFFVVLPWNSIWMIHAPSEGKDSSKAWREDAPHGLLKFTEE